MTLELDVVQQQLRDASLDGWLFYDFRGSDPIARKVLGLPIERPGTRRWFYFIPVSGEAVKLVHAIEPGMLDALPGDRHVYLSWQSLQAGLETLLRGVQRVAMQYSPNNNVPYVSRLDAGTFEQIRSLNIEVVSSADLVQRFDAVLSEAQVASHGRAARLLRGLIDEVFAYVKETVVERGQTTEAEVLEFLTRRLDEEGMVYDHAPIIAVGAHAADPHFEVPETGSAAVKSGELLLVDVWAKEKAVGSIYADITWTTFVGERVPEEMAVVFRVVRDARDAAVERAREAFRADEALPGYELDRAARAVIEDAGYGEFFIHRTGHSIHEEGHGNGANLDDLETHDTRCLIAQTLFSVEPGIYLPGRFGIRSEVNVLHTGSDAEVTGPPHQRELEPLL